MSRGPPPPPIAVILSDSDDSPAPRRPTKRPSLTAAAPAPTVLVIDDDPTPEKPTPSRTPSFVADTPLSALASGASIVRCSLARSSPPLSPPRKFDGITGLICLESDNELEGSSHEGSLKKLVAGTGRNGLTPQSEMCSSLSRPSSPVTTGSEKNCVGVDVPEQEAATASIGTTVFTDDVYSPPLGDFLSRDAVTECVSLTSSDYHYEEPSILRQADLPTTQKESTTKRKRKTVNSDKSKSKIDGAARKEQLKEEKNRLSEEKKQKRLQEKLQKVALKAETAALKKAEKEKQKWEKGKFAIKSIVAEVDAKVVEIGSVGGHLLTRLAEKGLSFRITSNPVERSILWKMSLPDQIAEVSSVGSEVPYILIVLQAEEFCNLVNSGSFMDHVHKVRGHYPSFTICYLTNKLMSYVNKCEQTHYKNSSDVSCWKRPPVEEVLSKLTTHFFKVHSRQCIDEAELAEHIVGLTSSLATCQFRKKLTWLSVNANGSIIPKDFIDRKLIKNSLWLKALIAIPKVQPRYALAIWKKYPTMRSLLNVYMDSTKSVHEKQFLLKDLMIEGLLGTENRRLGEVCSTRVYRILMAQSGGIKTDDVEDGADYFGGS